MKKVLKWIGIVLGGLIALVLLVAIVLYTKARIEFTHKYAVQVEAVSVPTDAASVERGKHLAAFLCQECHGNDLGGNPRFFAAAGIGSASAPNLTAGAGGLGAQFSDADFVRVLRHGVKPDGTSVFIMPSENFVYLSDQDLGALIAYLRTVLPVNQETPEPHTHFTFMGGVMYGAGLFGKLLRAPEIESMGEIAAAPQPGVTAEYGKYLVDINGCRDCHGEQLSGGRAGDPNAALAPNLTPGGELQAWSEADFVKAIRTGRTPAGTRLRSEFMPWKYKAFMADDELKAVWAYLQSLPALPTTTAPAE